MKAKYQNIFFVFGLVLFALMATQLDFQQVCDGLRHAGYWFFAVLALWAFLYVFNTTAWYIIIQANGQTKVKFWWLYKVTISGFAINYATPAGLMGGEPYRIMELSPLIGTERATSSVILYAMTHIFSHFWFWLLSAIVFIILTPMTPALTVLMATIVGLCLLGLWLFISGYRKGLAVRAMNLVRHLPFVKAWATRFVDAHKAQLDTIDSQIAALHRQNRRTFVSAVLLELACRVCSALEIYFILRVLMPHVDYVDCVLILAFTSLFANLLFFMPLQIGGREGGFLMSATSLGMSTTAGIFVALIVRLRELVWTGLGLLLIKVGKRHTADAPPTA